MMKLNLQFFAHKKGVGSTKNGRDSESKRLGAKRADGCIRSSTLFCHKVKKEVQECLQTEQKYLYAQERAATDM